MYRYSLLEAKRTSRCQRCGGQLIRSRDEISCLQCSAPHTEEGKLAIYPAQQYMILLGVLESTSQATSGKGRRSRRAHHWTRKETNMAHA